MNQINAAVGLVKDRISAIDPILLRDIMDELATDCFQDIAKEYRRFELAYKGILY